jgi:hypothetical protein
MAAGLGFKTFNTGDVLSAADTNGYLMQGVLVFANAAARDAAITSPQEGQCCYLKDTDAVQTYSGSAWVALGVGAWTSWTPTYQNFTIGNATVTARYQQVGKLTNAFCKIVFGSTTSFTAYPIIFFPSGLTSARTGYFTGTFNADDVSAGTSFTGTVYLEGSADKFQGAVTNASSTYAYAAFMTGNTIPMTWTTGDIMTFSFTFEAA